MRSYAYTQSLPCYSGLPNIPGTLPGNQLGTVGSAYIPGWQGAIRIKQITEGRSVSTVQSADYKVTWDAEFDASKGNAIYGASTTNQPAALQVYCLIRY